MTSTMTKIMTTTDAAITVPEELSLALDFDSTVVVIKSCVEIAVGVPTESVEASVDVTGVPESSSFPFESSRRVRVVSVLVDRLPLVGVHSLQACTVLVLTVVVDSDTVDVVLVGELDDGTVEDVDVVENRVPLLRTAPSQVPMTRAV